MLLRILCSSESQRMLFALDGGRLLDREALAGCRVVGLLLVVSELDGGGAAGLTLGR
jgi:hypothetical protein